MVDVDPHYVTLANGQIHCFGAGAGPSLVVLPGLILGAEPRAADFACRFPGWRVVGIELPGIGGSANVHAGSFDELVDCVVEFLTTSGMAGCPLIAYDLNGPLAIAVAARLARRPAAVLWIDAAAVRSWMKRGHTPGIAIRADGTHLTSLWTFVRNTHIFKPDDPRVVEKTGSPVPSKEQLNATIIPAAVSISGYNRLWDLCASPPPDIMITRLEEVGCRELPGIEAVAAFIDPLKGKTPPAAPLADTTKPVAGNPVWRSYVDVPRGRFHLRRAGGGKRNLIACQSAPGSSEPLLPVLQGFARTHNVVAPDYLGNGDSSKPLDYIKIEDIARDIIDLADALGFETFDMFGTHTGALVAMATALLAPDRVRAAILEAPPLMDPATTADILANYFDPVEVDRWGAHLYKTWHLRCDMFSFFPWHNASRAQARNGKLAVPEEMHDWTIGLLKSGPTYDRSYRAAWEYDTATNLGRLKRPCLLCSGPDDPLLAGVLKAKPFCSDSVSFSMTPATVWVPEQSAGDVERTFAIYDNFLTTAA